MCLTYMYVKPHMHAVLTNEFPQCNGIWANGTCYYDKSITNISDGYNVSKPRTSYITNHAT